MIEDDIYGDLENFNDENNLNDLKTENGQLREEVENLKLKIEGLTEENLVVKKKFQDYKSNISSLLMTARLEVERKDRLIADLNKEKDELVFKKFEQQNNFRKFDYPKHNGTEDTGQKRKFERPELNDAKRLKVNNQVLDNQQPMISTAPNTDHINSNATKSRDDKNCLQKLIMEMEEDNGSIESKASKIKLNRRKSICGYKVYEDKLEVQLHAVKHEIDELEKKPNSSKVNTDRAKRLSSVEDNKIDQDNKYGLQNNILRCDLDKSVKIEMSGKKTVCDSTTSSPKEDNSNVSRSVENDQENFETKEQSEQKKAFKIQRSRRQSMNEDILRRRDFSPELAASIHPSRRDFSRDDFHTRRARNASCDRQRDIRATRAHHRDPRNRPHSRQGSHDRPPDPRTSSYDTRPDSRINYHDRHADPRISSRISHRDPRQSAAYDNRPDLHNVNHESHRSPRYASRDRPCRKRSFSTRNSEKNARNTYTRSHSKEGYDADTHSQHRSCQKPTESHKTVISIKKNHEKLNIRENVSVEEMENTLSLRYSDSDESNSNQNFKELDPRRKMSELVDLKHSLVSQISNLESGDATVNNKNTFLSATVKSENNNVNQFSQLDSRNDVYAYISTLSNHSTECRPPLDSLSTDKGFVADSAPTSDLYQDYSQKLPTFGSTIMSPSDQNEPQTVDTPQNERKEERKKPNAFKNKPLTFMKYVLDKIDDTPIVHSKSSSNIANTDVRDVFELISSTLDPRQKQFTAKNNNTENKQLLELSQISHIKVEEDLVDKACIKVDDILDKSHIKVEDVLLDKVRIKVDEDLLEEAHIKVNHDLQDKANVFVKQLACSTLSSPEIKNEPNESTYEGKVPNIEIKNISTRKSPRKNIKKFKIPKIKSNGKEDLSEVSKLNEEKKTGNVKDEKDFIINEDQKSKIKVEEKKNKNKYKRTDSKVLTDKPESNSSKVSESRHKKSDNSTKLQAPQDTISSSESTLAKALNTSQNDIKRSTKLTESSTVTKLKSNTVRTSKVKTYQKHGKKEARTTSSNEKTVNKDKKQSIVKTTQKTNECQENIDQKKIDSGKFEEKPSNQNHRKLNECLENVSTPNDKTLLSETKNKKNGDDGRKSANFFRSRAENSELDKILERTGQTKCDQLHQNEADLNSSQGETVNKRRKLYSHTDDDKETSDTPTLCNKHNEDTIVDIKQDACSTLTLENSVNKNVRSTRDLKYPKSGPIKRKARSVIIHSNDICEDETSTEIISSKVTTEDFQKQEHIKDTSKHDIHLLIAPNIDKILITEKETSSKITRNKADNSKTNLRNNKKTQDSPLCESEQKYIMEINKEHTESQKLEDKQLTASLPTHYNISTDNKSLPSDDGNYMIKIRRKRKIVKTF